MVYLLQMRINTTVMVIAGILNVDTECQHPTGASPQRWSTAIVGFSFQGILYHILELCRQVIAIIVPGLSANKKHYLLRRIGSVIFAVLCSYMCLNDIGICKSFQHSPATGRAQE